MKKQLHFFSMHSPLPHIGTKAAMDFFASWEEINSLFQFILHLVGTNDKMSEVAHKTLVILEDDPAIKQEVEKQWTTKKKAIEVLREQRQLFLEIILVRHIENYLNYLSSLLFEIFTQRPETLRSSEKIEVADLLKHETMDDVVRDVAERKVSALSYSSISTLADFFSDRFSLSLASSSQMPAVCEATEIRNISVHNRCIINDRFRIRTGCTPELLGQKKLLFLANVENIVPLLAELVKTLDKKAKAKLKLKTIRFKQAKKSAPINKPTDIPPEA